MGCKFTNNQYPETGEITGKISIYKEKRENLEFK